MITASICLTDLQKEHIVEAKNGKKYLNFVVQEMREPSQYGDTHTLYIQQSKEERDAGVKRVYIGNGKEWEFKNDGQTAPTKKENNSDGLPF